MLARTPAEMDPAYKLLENMNNALEETHNELKTFSVYALVQQAQEKLRLVNRTRIAF